MRRVLLAVVVVITTFPAFSQSTYLGFDKDSYPGDDLLPALRRDFAWTGYWLNNPPGMTSNPWEGKREVIRSAGLGFVILFNGRLDAQLKGDAAALGRQDAAAAIASAKREGFPKGAIIFLDQEEGGALLPEQAAYIGAWITDVGHSAWKPGVYCSGVPVPSGSKMISTAQDVQTRFPTAKLWVWDDRCPPSPGCVANNSPNPAFNPSTSGFAGATIWQYAQSPRRPEDTSACQRTYAADHGCYAPNLPHSLQTWIDLNVSGSPDPSHGR
jgi:hypothetical protein